MKRTLDMAGGVNVEIDPGRLARAIHLDCQRVKPDTYLVSGGAADHIVEIVNGAVRLLRRTVPRREL